MNVSSLILASASPRRAKILKSMGLAFDVVVPVVDEVHWGDDPEGTVRENAARKCAWACSQHSAATIIAADTVVVLDGKSIGKPNSRDEAVAMLRNASGCTQCVFTGMVMRCLDEQRLEQHTEMSRVHFCELTDAVIEQYYQHVNPLDKAGGYDIDQKADLIIRAYEGSWTNIMGLPQEVLERWLECK